MINARPLASPPSRPQEQWLICGGSKHPTNWALRRHCHEHLTMSCIPSTSGRTGAAPLGGHTGGPRSCFFTFRNRHGGQACSSLMRRQKWEQLNVNLMWVNRSQDVTITDIPGLLWFYHAPW